MTWSLVLCEGFADRNFLKGLFEQRLRLPVCDRYPWSTGRKVAAGRFGFGSFEQFVLVLAAAHAHEVADAWTELERHRPDRVIVVVDSDQTDASPLHGRRRIASQLTPIGGSLDEHTGAGRIGDAVVEAVVWRGGPGEPRPGVPAKHTLERLIAESFADVWPDRASDVGRWLATAPTPDDVTHKHVASAILAKWFAEDGPSDAFYRKVWFEPALAGRLEARLREQGEWDRFTRLGGAPGDRSLSA